MQRMVDAENGIVGDWYTIHIKRSFSYIRDHSEYQKLFLCLVYQSSPLVVSIPFSASAILCIDDSPPHRNVVTLTHFPSMSLEHFRLSMDMQI
jgi:hypothetical protein